MDSRAPTFSLVTPVFNGMPWLPEAQASIAREACDEISVEHLVFDAGSRDGSREYLMSHPDASRIDVFEPDGGQADALRRGFQRARGEYLGWLNADDVLLPGALRRVAQVFAESPEAVIVSGACLVIDADGDVCSALPNNEPAATVEDVAVRRVNFPQPATFFRRSAYLRTKGIDPSLHLAMDVDLWLQLAAVGPARVLSRETLAAFRVHEGAKTARNALGTRLEDWRVRRRHGLPLGSERSARFAAEILRLVSPAPGDALRAIRSVFVRRPPVPSKSK